MCGKQIDDLLKPQEETSKSIKELLNLMKLAIDQQSMVNESLASLMKMRQEKLGVNTKSEVKK